MEREILWFSHANGFPASTYRRLFDALADRYDIRAIERVGHDERYPVEVNWSRLVDELLDHLVRDVPDKAWLVGHSLGGYLSLMAAQRMPHKVRGVVMLDSPLLTGWRARLMRVGRLAGLDGHFTPAGVTLRRRNHWPDRAAVWQHFQAKPVFARWDAQVLDDYVDHGTYERAEGGRALRFDPRIEYHIYRTLPLSLTVPSRGLPVPVGFVAGRHSREVRLIGLRATRQLVGSAFEWIEGSHLFPMEQPLATAAAIQRLLASFQSIPSERAARR